MRCWTLIAGAFLFRTRRTIITVKTPENYTLSCPADYISYWGMFILRDLHHREWMQHMSSRAVVLDIGANRGWFTRYARSMGVVLIHAFEPLKQFNDRLVGVASRVHNVALCEKGTLDKKMLHINRVHGEDSTASFTQYSSYSQVVDCVALDDIDLPYRVIDLIKIDVDGGELNVIRGGMNTINRARHLLIEIEHEDKYNEIVNNLLPAWKHIHIEGWDYVFINPVKESLFELPKNRLTCKSALVNG